MREANAMQEWLWASKADMCQEIGDKGRECGPAGQREASGQREQMWAWWLVCDPILVLFRPC